VSLGILGLNEDFVQLNEVMNISKIFILNYVTQLGGKKFWLESRSVRVFVPKTVTEIFLGALARSAN